MCLCRNSIKSYHDVTTEMFWASITGPPSAVRQFADMCDNIVVLKTENRCGRLYELAQRLFKLAASLLI
jgi:hypothetical protein